MSEQELQPTPSDSETKAPAEAPEKAAEKAPQKEYYYTKGGQRFTLDDVPPAERAELMQRMVWALEEKVAREREASETGEASEEADPALRELAGFPSAAQAVTYVDHLAADLWS